ncbi:hypothetical protein V5F53_12945 [Xanthobacter sp. V4C-4]|uniref:hypothetical protein n=1 Tax=Xanthobacter cornucopiae TaxID=3119924 RepID=UPI00372758C5
MAAAFQLLALLAIAAALASWGVAVAIGLQVFAARRWEGRGNGIGARLLLLFWPFALRRRADDDGPLAARTGKATVAFFVALTLAVAAISASTNLNHSRASAGKAAPVPGAPPSKS